jgi:multimeric flavodoxin WrbA
MTSVLAINGSPRMKASNTFGLLDPLLAGMRDAGATTDIIHVRQLDMSPCIGCLNCWTRTPGDCFYNDGMNSVFDRFTNADIIVFGTPLYHCSMSGLLKGFIDRLLPRLEPWFVPHPDEPDLTIHPTRLPKRQGMVVVSACGFPEYEHFNALVMTFQQIAKTQGYHYLGHVLRPCADGMRDPANREKFAPYLDRVRQAGSQLILDGVISADVNQALSDNPLPDGKDGFYASTQALWQSLLSSQL